ncbi:dehydrogenase/reductase SDR family member 11-like [Ptychodera flava]|uniref:dehydrogenase/reductase SDR family member 11-like n=1 Tax=Ptychodera flava TaxID=63121 RepID=UPI00396A1BF7
MERWNGRVALVTGASTGIGNAIAKQLALHGMRVIGCGRDVSKIQETESDLLKLDSSKTIDLYAIKCDLRNEQDILAMFDDIGNKYGRLDICINNAGIAFPERLMSGDTEKWREMFETLMFLTNVVGMTVQQSIVNDGMFSIDRFAN